MTLGTMQNWQTSTVLAGGIDLGDREGVHCRSFAVRRPMIQTVHGAMEDGNDLSVYHAAECFLCEWAYRPSDNRLEWEGLEPVTYKFESPDVMDVVHWSGVHRQKGSHVRAVHYFRQNHQ